MSSLPNMPVQTTEYLADTRYLTLEQQGAYMLLLTITWRNGGKPIRDDAALIARYLSVPVNRWLKVIRPALEPLFDLSGGSWLSVKLAESWRFITEKRAVLAQSGSKGGMAKSLKNKANAVANASDLPQHININIRSKKEERELANASLSASPTASDQAHGLDDSLDSQKEEEKKEARAEPERRNAPSDQPHQENCSAPEKSISVPRNNKADIAKAMLAVWEQELGDALPTRGQPSKTRIDLLNRRLEDSFGNDIEGKWRDYCRGIRDMPFLLGEGKSGWRANLDWVLKPSNMAKILDGCYNDRRSGQGGNHGRCDQPAGERRFYGEDDREVVEAAIRSAMLGPELDGDGPIIEGTCVKIAEGIVAH